MTGHRPLVLGLEWPGAVPGGLNTYVAELHLSLRRTPDVDVTTIVLGDASGAPGVRTVASPAVSRARRLVAYTRAVRAELARSTVVDAHFALMVVPSLGALRRRHLPLMVHVHGPWADEAVAAGRRRGARARAAIERHVVQRADVVVCLSGSMARTAIERIGADPWRVLVVPPGVDRDRFSPVADAERRALRAGVGVGDDDLLVVTARRLVARTGVDLLVEAWPQVEAVAARAGRRAHLVVVGDGPESGPLQRRARAQSGDVTFTGAVPDDQLVEWYRRADLSVVPSRALEGYGLVVLESLATGTPVLVTDVGGLPEAVGEVGRDLVVAPSADAVAARLADVVARRVPLPARGVCRDATVGRDWDAVADAHVAAFDALAAPPATDPCKVVLVDHSAQLSGGELAATRLVAALPDTRVHGVLFEDGPLVPELAAVGATVEVRPLAAGARRLGRHEVARARNVAGVALTTGWFALRLARRLRRLRPDVVHANSLKAGLVGGTAARLAGIPMVWHVRDRLADDYLPARSARLVRFGIRHLAAAVVVPSDAVLRTIGPTPPRVARYVVPDAAIRVPAEEAAAPGEPRDLHVVMVGRLAPWKGQDVFLDAFARAFADGGAHASIVGDALFGEDAFRSELERRCAELGLADVVRFEGHRRDVDAVYAGADVVVHASVVPEPFGQVVVEAMAAGRPVIATSGGGPSEIVTDGCEGLLVPPGDPVALAAALTRLAADPEARRRMGAAGRRRARRYDPDRIGAEVAAVHRAVAGREQGGEVGPA